MSSSSFASPRRSGFTEPDPEVETEVASMRNRARVSCKSGRGEQLLLMRPLQMGHQGQALL